MNSSYKIALVVCVVICVVLVAVFSAKRTHTTPSSESTIGFHAGDGDAPLSTGSSGSPSTANNSALGSTNSTKSSTSLTNPTPNVSSSVNRNTTGELTPVPSVRNSRSNNALPSAANSGTSLGLQTPTPAPAPAAPAPVGNYRSYTIRSGDNFNSLAKRLYGSDKYWVQIAQANPTIDPVRLKIGQVIKLPILAPGNPAPGSSTDSAAAASESDNPADPAGLASSSEAAPAVPAKPGKTHIVRPGETLASIARRYYKDPEKWRIIFDANQSTIGNEPDDLEAGMKLTIPPAK